MTDKLPELMVFAGPNGSGKSTITNMVEIKGRYVNADDIQKSLGCDPLEAAKLAEQLRENSIAEGVDLTFETVLSTDRNLKLMKSAKAKGYFIRTCYVLTASSNINCYRIKSRKLSGGHDVPKDKIISRYNRCMKLLPEVIQNSDICNIYDNSDGQPIRIFSKKKSTYRMRETSRWTYKQIAALTAIPEDSIIHL